MKGIAHFITGVALATCFPRVVELAREGSLLPVLGGVGGLLPDLLDFRFVRYFEVYDREIDPAPLLSESQDGGEAAASGTVAAAHVVDILVGAIHTAAATGQPQNVIVHTVRLGHDLWRGYTLRFDPDAGTVAVRFGPRVNTGGVSFPGSELQDSVWVERRLDVPMGHGYSREYQVEAFTGPTFRFAFDDGKVAVHFLDWHHRWTHSLPLALLVGVIIGVTVGLILGPQTGGWAGLLVALGFAGHVLEDQLGHMGSNLFWPFTRRRLPGLKLLHAGDAVPNFLTTWTSLALIVLNLDRFGDGLLPVRLYVACLIALPWLGCAVPYATRSWRAAAGGVSPQALGATEEAERLGEAQGFGEG